MLGEILILLAPMQTFELDGSFLVGDLSELGLPAFCSVCVEEE